MLLLTWPGFTYMVCAAGCPVSLCPVPSMCWPPAPTLVCRLASGWVLPFQLSRWLVFIQRQLFFISCLVHAVAVFKGGYFRMFRVLRILRHYHKARAWSKWSHIDHPEEKGTGKGSGWQSFLSGWDNSIPSQANSGTVSKALGCWKLKKTGSKVIQNIVWLWAV